MAAGLGQAPRFGTDVAPSQLDPTAHGADYGFLDFTQTDAAAPPNGVATQPGFPEFAGFSQVRSLQSTSTYESQDGTSALTVQAPEVSSCCHSA